VKVDNLTRSDFEAEGRTPFVYGKGGTAMTWTLCRACRERAFAPVTLAMDRQPKASLGAPP